MTAVATEPGGEYRRRLDDWRARRTRLEMRVRRLLRARRALLGVIVALCILAEKERVVTKLVLILTPALLLDGLDRWRRRTHHHIEVAGRAADYYDDRLTRLDGTWVGRGPEGTRFLAEDHPCAADLDLFGPGGVFPMICLARTSAGEDVLADWLRTPADPDTVRTRQHAVAEARPDLDRREEAAILDPPGRVVEVSFLRAWARATSSPFPWWGRPVALALSVAAPGTLGAALVLNTGALAPVLALSLAGVFAWSFKGRVRDVLAGVKGRADDLALLAALARRLPEGRSASRRLARLAWLVRRLDVKNGLPQAPLASAVLWTTHVAFAAAAWRSRWGASLDGWLSATGEREALASLAGHAYENPDDPFPEFVADGPLFEAEGLAHPLLPRGRCVPNDVSLSRRESLLVVSGSNMSGKSTLLRAVGVNAVLAQAGAPVRARRLRLSPLTVGATMRVQDSLRDGRSRFYAEVLRVRLLLALAKEPRPLLFLLDELFAGTNAEDRRRGGEAVVRSLVAAGALGLVTTHDPALTDLADALAPRARNVHFADHVAGGALAFDYVMRRGVAPRGNALAILRAAGFAV